MLKDMYGRTGVEGLERAQGYEERRERQWKTGTCSNRKGQKIKMDGKRGRRLLILELDVNKKVLMSEY